MTFRHADLIGDPLIHPPLRSDDDLELRGSGVPPFGVLHGTILVRPETVVNYRFHMKRNESRQESFGQWLRREIEHREWTAADFARRVGSSNGTTSLWLRDARLPSPSSVRKIAETLGVDEDVALTIAGHKSPDPYLDADSPEVRLLPLIRQVEWNEDRLDATEAYLRGYIKNDEKRLRVRNET